MRRGASVGRWTGMVLAGVACAVGGVSCTDFGEGGTGERIIPRRTLREIERTDLSAFAVPTAATQPIESLPTTLPATTAPVMRELSLEGARELALKNNLDLAVQRIAPAIARESLSAERARFEAVFTTDVRYSTFDSPTSSRLQSATGDSTSVSPGLRVPLQSGGTILLDLPVNQSGNDNSFNTLNPAYTAGPSATLSQPLLRGFGTAAQAAPIRVAFYASQQAQARTKLEVIRVLANVDRLYWRLYASQRNLEVRRAEFDVAAALLQRNRRRLAARIDPEVEVLRAESALADRIEAVQTAENDVLQRTRELKRIINSPGLEMDSPVSLTLATEPGTLYARLDRGALVRSAILNRMELLDTELQLLSDSASIAASRNGLLPLVSLSYTYRVSGLGGSFEEAFAQAGANRFADNTLGVTMEVPIGNEAARSRLRQSLLARMQTLASKTARQAQVTQELLDAADALELSRQNIVAAQRRVILNRRLLEAETRLLEAGQRTSTEVLEAQSRLAAARSSEVQAVASFQIAQVDIAFASGTLLGAGNVVWEPVSSPRVPRYFAR